VAQPAPVQAKPEVVQTKVEAKPEVVPAKIEAKPEAKQA